MAGGKCSPSKSWIIAEINQCECGWRSQSQDTLSFLFYVQGAHYLVDTDKTTKVLQNPSKCQQNIFSGKNMLALPVVEMQAVAHRVSFNRKHKPTKYLTCFPWHFEWIGMLLNIINVGSKCLLKYQQSRRNGQNIKVWVLFPRGKPVASQ